MISKFYSEVCFLCKGILTYLIDSLPKVHMLSSTPDNSYSVTFFSYLFAINALVMQNKVAVLGFSFCTVYPNIVSPPDFFISLFFFSLNRIFIH